MSKSKHKKHHKDRAHHKHQNSNSTISTIAKPQLIVPPTKSQNKVQKQASMVDSPKSRWSRFEHLKTMQLYVKMRLEHSLRGDFRWVKQELTLLKPIVREVAVITCLVLFTTLFIAGLGFGGAHGSRNPQEAEAGYRQTFTNSKPLLLWQVDEQESKNSDILEVNTLLKNSTAQFLAVEYNQGIVHYEGRIPSYSAIDISRENSLIKIKVRADNNASITNCKYSANNSINAKLTKTQGDIKVDDGDTDQNNPSSEVNDLRVQLIPTISSNTVEQAKKCIDSTRGTLAKYYSAPISIRISVASVRYGPDKLITQGIPDDLANLIANFRLCPCSEDPNMPASESEWVRKIIEDKPDSDYIELVGVFDIIPGTGVTEYASDQVNSDTFVGILNATRNTYNAHLKQLISVNGKGTLQLMSDYNYVQEQKRLVQESDYSGNFGGGYSYTGGSSAASGGGQNAQNTNSGINCNDSDASLSQLYCLINQYRSQNGLGALGVDGAMQQAAANHNQWMVNTGNFSHVGENGSRFFDRCGAVGTTCSNEIIAKASYTSASQCMLAWKNSASHNAALLNPGFGTLGGAISGGYCTVVLR